MSMINFLYHLIKAHNIKIGVLILSLLLCCLQTWGQNPGVRRYTNSLVHETSPYLLQHAHNPVNWKPWSQDAFDGAKTQDKLLIISIGYSSCHWCHVMEEESFEDEEVAKIMNENFINIKVDREERPDVDQVYQDFQRLTEGNTGWPLNVIALPNGKPFYGGTYHTKDQWIRVLTKMNELYEKDPEKATEYTDMVADGIAEINLIEPASGFESLTKDALKSGVEKWKLNWDSEWGGDKVAEKFMVPSNLDFLLDYAELTEDVTARAHVENTLDKILFGGVYDHIGGGFFRYSTDTKWKVPHFEKMLYDNAQAIGLYAKAFKIFKKPEYRDAVMETIGFLEQEMKNAEGGYYSALDSQSEGEEGKFYIWKEEELKSVLKDDLELFASYYNIAPEAVWEEGNYVLHKSVDDKAFLEKHSISMSELESTKQRWRKKLLTAREKRVRPRSDDKILTSWNALLIQGLVTSYETFGQKGHLEKAEAIFEFLKKNSYAEGELIHSYKKGGKHNEGFLEDYAFLIDASLRLFEATMKTKYFDYAKGLLKTAELYFADSDSGMYKFNRDDELIVKIIKTHDGVMPSPNAVMAHNMFKLGHMTYNLNLVDKTKTMLSTMLPFLEKSPGNYTKWFALFSNIIYPYFEIAVVGKDARLMLANLNRRHLPNSILLGSELKSNLPLFRERFVENETYIYVCQNSTCKLPVTSIKEALDVLNEYKL